MNLILVISFTLLVLILVCIKLYKGNSKQETKIGLGIVVLTVLFVGYLIYTNSKPNQLIITDNYIEFTESYGTKVLFEDIKNIQKLTQLPEIKLRTNGYALGDIRKGIFKTISNEKIYLLINGTHKPYLKITTKEGKQLFFNSKEKNIKNEYEKLQNIFSYQKKPLSK